MYEARQVWSIEKDTKSLKTYLVPSTGNFRFEVKDHDEILYNGKSFERAMNLYEKLCRN